MANALVFLRSVLTKERTVFAVHLCALCAFAIAQPLYDLIARNADFLTAHHLSSIDVVIFTLILCLGPPALLILSESSAALLLGTRVGTGLHRVLVIGLVALIVSPLLKRYAQLPTSYGVVLSLLAGLLVTLCYVRFAAVRTFFTLSAVAVVVFPLNFLFFSPVSQILFGGGEGSRYGQGTVGSDVPIVFIVFDEFPVTSIMDEDGNIDASAVPNFAALAKTCTWYRNASTVSDYTTAALPGHTDRNISRRLSAPPCFQLSGESLHVAPPLVPHERH